jgi:4-hydroxy-tetrahydrodipicolinate synthase
MSTVRDVPRRRFLQALGAGAICFGATDNAGRKPLRGIFPIVQTPFTESNKLDLEVLAGEVRFLDRARAHGCVWPQNASEWSSLSESERLAGAETILATGKKLRPAIVIGVQAPTMDAAVRYARHAQTNGADAIISLPLAGADMPALLEYYKAIGKATDLPLFAQAVGDFSVDHLIELYRAVPTLRYIKDEAGQPLLRFAELKEKSHGQLHVFSGGGKNQIDEMIRGFSGCMPFSFFADVQAAAWDLWHEGKRREAVDVFGNVAMMLEEIGVYGLEAVKYILVRRGVFKTYRVREKKRPGTLDAPARQTLEEMLALMKPHLG